MQTQEQPSVDDLQELWGQLGNVPVDVDGYLEAPFLHFAVGTDREDVWHWFEAQHPDVSVAAFMSIAKP